MYSRFGKLIFPNTKKLIPVCTKGFFTYWEKYVNILCKVENNLDKSVWISSPERMGWFKIIKIKG